MVSVLTLNLRFGLAPDGPNGWEFRKESLAALLRQYNAVFMGFQEANDFQIDYLCGILTDFKYIGRRRPAPPSWQSDVIFYRMIFCEGVVSVINYTALWNVYMQNSSDHASIEKREQADV